MFRSLRCKLVTRDPVGRRSRVRTRASRTIGNDDLTVRERVTSDLRGFLQQVPSTALPMHLRGILNVPGRGLGGVMVSIMICPSPRFSPNLVLYAGLPRGT